MKFVDEVEVRAEAGAEESKYASRVAGQLPTKKGSGDPIKPEFPAVVRVCPAVSPTCWLALKRNIGPPDLAQHRLEACGEAANARSDEQRTADC